MLIEEIGYPAMLEQTAEECNELAHACLKLARHLRKENPTSKSADEILDNLYEEVADVLLCIDELNLSEGRVENWRIAKNSRMVKRIQEWKKNGKSTRPAQSE